MSVGLAREHARLGVTRAGRWTVHRMLVLSLILSGSLVLVPDCVLIVLGGVSAREHLACGRDLTIVPFSPALVFLFSEEGRRIDRKCRVGRVIECVLSWVATQWSWTMQQASRASQGFSPGQPLYRIPQYFPYLSSGGTFVFMDRVDKKKKRSKRISTLCR